MSIQTFHSNGKLILTGEYLVIDGAKGLAIPTKKGQSLTVEKSGSPSTLVWRSLTQTKECWLEVEFSLPSLEVTKTSDEEKSTWLQQLLLNAKELSDSFLNDNESIRVTTHLEFPQNWGLGSSSTLINNVAQWAKVDPFELHFSISNGSGYDIACAFSKGPLVYLNNENQPIYQSVDFSPPFKENLFFVFLNQKQNSFREVEGYNTLKKEINIGECSREINEITEKMLTCSDLELFNELIDQHEYILSNILQRETIKEKLFPMYHGSIKSLGAWGGDFIMITGTRSDMDYFVSKGYSTIYSFVEFFN